MNNSVSFFYEPTRFEQNQNNPGTIAFGAYSAGSAWPNSRTCLYDVAWMHLFDYRIIKDNNDNSIIVNEATRSWVITQTAL
jgi:hypothetical protein